MNTSLLSSALVFCGSRVAFAGFTGSDHASDAVGISNETVIDWFTKLSLVAVVHLINIGAAWNTLKPKAGEPFSALVLIGAGIVLNDATVGCTAVDQACFVFWAIGTVYAGQALTQDFHLPATGCQKHEA